MEKKYYYLIVPVLSILSILLFFPLMIFFGMDAEFIRNFSIAGEALTAVQAVNLIAYWHHIFTNKKLNDTDQFLWGLLVLMTGFIGQLIYWCKRLNK